MSYRNKKWYLSVLQGKAREWAYEYISENLKRPAFVYEPENAHAAYKEIFGVDFASPQEMAAISAAEKIRQLEAEVEKLRVEKKQDDRDFAKMGQSEIEPIIEQETVEQIVNAVAAPSVINTKEDFLAANPGLNGLKGLHEWRRYAKEHGIETNKDGSIKVK